MDVGVLTLLVRTSQSHTMLVCSHSTPCLVSHYGAAGAGVG